MERRGEETQQLETTDLYLASYLLMNGCRLVGVECVPAGGAVSCGLAFTGSNVRELQDTYFGQKAEVNLLQFRSAYNQVNGYVHQAKKNHDRERRALGAGGGL